MKKINVIGIILTVIITVGFTWSIVWLAGLNNEKNLPDVEEKRANEVEAFRNLKAIADAQEKYKQKDWDGDGKKVYAVFYVHLWRSVSLKGEPIRVNLIPKKLAFAMEASGMVNGYYYKDLRLRGTEGGTGREFAYEKEWAVAALPGTKGITGLLSLITDQTGTVYVTPRLHTGLDFPRDPAANGWTRINTIEELREFQNKVDYGI